MPSKPVEDVFSRLSKPMRVIVKERGFPTATEPQSKAIPSILEGKNVLLIAPTGTGKTEAAFLPVLDAIYTMPYRTPGVKAIYITPLRALNRDLLERLEWWCKKLDIRLAVRHGDTEVRERGRQAIAPPDVLITTPETLQAVLPGSRMRGHLRHVRWVIVDEAHELAGEKRGSQLSIGLERLRQIADEEFQVIGLSATVGTPQAVASFLVGTDRPCEVIQVPVARSMKLQILYPEAEEEDEELASRIYTFPEVAARLRLIRRLVEGHDSTLIFTNTRTEAEILSSRFRVWDSGLPIAVHHGSLSKPTRVSAERGLKEGELSSIVCTSSLELGIDVGLLDFVIQYNSPRQVTRLLQRVGRSGHKVGGVAEGVVITQDSDDALESLVIARRALAEELEPVRIPEKPYDALSHQLVGLLLHKSRWYLDEALSLITKAYPYRTLSKEELVKVLEYMHSRYPRLAWFSKKDEIFTKPFNVKDFYTYYFENLSMIPEERHYLVLQEDGSPVGVLDEAFVAEYGEIGTRFVEAGSVWRITQLMEDKIYVKKEEDPTGAIPTWVGEEIPVPYEVAQGVGMLRREVEERLQKKEDLHSIASDLASTYPCDGKTFAKALAEVGEQVESGEPLPTDRRVTVEGWGEYVIIQCCFGHMVNRTLARILGHIFSEKVGATISVQQDPYRIVLRGGQVTPNAVKDAILALEGWDVEAFAKRALVKTSIFKRRMVHAAKKFGALAKDADLGSVGLSSLIEALSGTVVYEEAVRTALREDADVEGTRMVLERVEKGQVEVVESTKDRMTPTARIGMEKIIRRSDIVPPDRMRKVLVEAARARLLSEARTVACTKCWEFVDIVKMRDLVKAFTCPQCGSRLIGMVGEGQEKVENLAEKMRMKKGEVPKKMKRLHSSLIKSAELFSKHGFPAAVVLAGRGIGPSEGAAILGKESVITDRLVELVIDAERLFLKRRYFMPKHTETRRT